MLVGECERLPGMQGTAVHPSLCVGQCSPGRAGGGAVLPWNPREFGKPQPETLHADKLPGDSGPRVWFSP